MIIAGLILFENVTFPLINLAPFVYKAFPTFYDISDNYWINTFGAQPEFESRVSFLASFVTNYNEYYFETNSILYCIDQESYFFWDNENQILYVHFSHSFNFLSGKMDIGVENGYNDTTAVYIDDVFYSPLLLRSPSISQQQDLVNYKQMSFINGTVRLNNTQGALDFLKDTSIYGNELRLYYVPYDGQRDYHRSELERLATFYVENYNISLTEISIKVQDVRKAQNLKIPTDKFLDDDYPNIENKYIGKIIPLIYGNIRISTAIPTNGLDITSDVTYRQALALSSLGTVQVEIDDKWTTVIPSSVDLSRGEFVILRVSGRKSNGVPYKCRVLDSIGIPITYSSDIIIDLNNRYQNISYNNSLYDQTEWETEQLALDYPIGIVFDKQIEIYKAILEVQSGSQVGFRYEIKADGRRTIRIDDWDRESSGAIVKEDIFNIDELECINESDLLAADVLVNYSLDYNDDVYLQTLNDDYSLTVLQKYRQQPQAEIDTLLYTLAGAQYRAAWFAGKFSEIKGTIKLELHGTEWFSVRIYDIFQAEITPGESDISLRKVLSGREFYGIWKIQVLSVSPDYNGNTNTIEAVLVEQISEVATLRITWDGHIRSLYPVGTMTAKREV